MFKIDAHQVAGLNGLAASRRARVASVNGTTGIAMYPCEWPTITRFSHKAWRPKESSP